MDGEKATNRRPGDQITTTSAHISLFPLPSWPFLAIGVGKEIKKKKKKKKKKRLVCKYPIGLIRQQLQKYFNFKKGERESQWRNS
jgi:uncharacterized membrane protein